METATRGAITAILCPNCSARNAPDSAVCTACGNSLERIRATLQGKPTAEAPPAHVLPGEATASYLRVLGWTVMVLGFIGGIWVIGKLGTVPAGLFNDEPRASPAGWMLGLGTIFQSIVAGSICIGIAVAIENTADIRRRLKETGREG